MVNKKLLTSLLYLLLVANFFGCALLLFGAAGGAGTAFWLSGKLKDKLNASYDKSIAAAKKAMKELGMTLKKETRSAEGTQIKSGYKDGQEVWIYIKPLGQEKTSIEIRVGLKRDKAACTNVLETIKKHI